MTCSRAGREQQGGWFDDDGEGGTLTSLFLSHAASAHHQCPFAYMDRGESWKCIKCPEGTTEAEEQGEAVININDFVQQYYEEYGDAEGQAAL